MIKVVAKACLADVHYMLKKHFVSTLDQYRDISFDAIVDKLYSAMKDDLYQLFVENIADGEDHG